eukprot:m.204399 g.204399  ORF g.204399 m.204399 type:complete len:448 (+) comp32885_c0_seq1:203-1546(+)
MAVEVAQFYATAGCTLTAMWLLFSVVSKSDVHDRLDRISLALRPSFMPTSILIGVLQRRWLYLALCHAATLSFLVAAYYPDVAVVRVCVAALFTAYVTVETSHSHSHRDYANMYITWSLAVLPDRLSAGFALGVCAHFISSSGVAKVVIGGATGWSHPNTMRAYLQEYGSWSISTWGPAVPFINRFAAKHDAVLVAISISTLFFECVAIPLALVAPPYMRVYLAVASVFMHVGITVMQSALIGVAFMPNVACYLLGFSAAGPKAFDFTDSAWLLAVVVVAASFGVVLTRSKVLPEDFPCTPFALFAWNGSQYQTLLTQMCKQRTRLVLSTSECLPIGYTIIPKGSPVGTTIAQLVQQAPIGVVHDAWEQVIGDTLVFNEVLQSVNFNEMQKSSWIDSSGPAELANAVTKWLQQRQRLVEITSGKFITHAHFVVLEEKCDRIKHVCVL